MGNDEGSINFIVGVLTDDVLFTRLHDSFGLNERACVLVGVLTDDVLLTQVVSTAHWERRKAYQFLCWSPNSGRLVHPIYDVVLTDEVRFTQDASVKMCSVVPNVFVVLLETTEMVLVFLLEIYLRLMAEIWKIRLNPPG